MSHRCKVSSLSAVAALLFTFACADDGAGDSTGAAVTATGSDTGEPPASTGEDPPPTSSTGPTASTGSTSDAPTTTSDDPNTTGATTTDATTGDDLCASSVLTWENFGEPFALSWCTGCHHSALPTAERAGAPCGVNLDTHAGASQSAARVHVRAIDWSLTPGLTPMPPAAIVPEEELALLREWLDCGAPGPETGMQAPMCPDP